MPELPPIPMKWIQSHVEKLSELAKELPEGPMREAVVLRCHTYLDLVREWKEAFSQGQ